MADLLDQRDLASLLDEHRAEVGSLKSRLEPTFSGWARAPNGTPIDPVGVLIDDLFLLRFVLSWDGADKAEEPIKAALKHAQ